MPNLHFLQAVEYLQAEAPAGRRAGDRVPCCPLGEETYSERLGQGALPIGIGFGTGRASCIAVMSRHRSDRLRMQGVDRHRCKSDKRRNRPLVFALIVILWSSTGDVLVCKLGP